MPDTNPPEDLRHALGDRYQFGPLLSTGYDGSTCHPLWGRHYHCANCGEISSYQGHMLGNPPAFKCPPKP